MQQQQQQQLQEYAVVDKSKKTEKANQKQSVSSSFICNYVYVHMQVYVLYGSFHAKSTKKS